MPVDVLVELLDDPERFGLTDAASNVCAFSADTASNVADSNFMFFIRLTNGKVPPRYNPHMKRLLMSMTVLTAGVFAQSNAELKEQVRRAEGAFAKTMADRDLAGFTKFLAEDAIFMASGEPARGPQAITARWKRFYEGKEAPFAWEPEFVEVLDSGTLATSQGPVRDRTGKRVGTFNSVWRREKNGEWKIILDSGCPPCPSCDGKQ